MVLQPGLPGSSFESCLADARRASELVDTIRIHPTLVLADSALRQLHMDGDYEPLALGEAVTVCAAMMDHIEQKGVKVIRVGQQAGPDGLGRAVAGPKHSSLRELVEARRTLEHLQKLLSTSKPGDQLVIYCATCDETRTRGPFNQHVRTLRADFRLGDLQIKADAFLERGSWRVERVQ